MKKTKAAKRTLTERDVASARGGVRVRTGVKAGDLAAGTQDAMKRVLWGAAAVDTAIKRESFAFALHSAAPGVLADLAETVTGFSFNLQKGVRDSWPTGR